MKCPLPREITPPAQVVMTDDAMIRRTTPANIIASLEADARRILAGQPDMACIVAARWPASGPRQQVVVLFAGHEKPADDGFISVTYMGEPRTVDETVRRALLLLLAGKEGSDQAREGRS